MRHMDGQASTGLLVIALVVIGLWLFQPRYPMKECPTCAGEGKEFEKGTRNFRVCTECHGNKSVPR